MAPVPFVWKASINYGNALSHSRNLCPDRPIGTSCLHIQLGLVLPITKLPIHCKKCRQKASTPFLRLPRHFNDCDRRLFLYGNSKNNCIKKGCRLASFSLIILLPKNLHIPFHLAPRRRHLREHKVPSHLPSLLASLHNPPLHPNRC